tara:strand:+ start:977 stop:1804 length:828 start_codon:yes stop_codon:yes gene_type:complete
MNPRNQESNQMSKKQSTELVEANETALVVPDFMQTAETEGLDEISKYQTTPRLTLIQGQSSPERKEQFGEGGVCIMPDNVGIAEPGEEFTVVPLVFWVTWEVWSDINDPTLPMVCESTMDETSDIARRAKNADLREEVYGDRSEYRKNYIECLNFIVAIDGGPSDGTIATLTFSKGEHYAGSKLCSFLKRRKVPIYGNRIALKSQARTRNNRSWWGLEFNNPADGNAFVTSKEKFEEFQAMHRELADLMRTSSLSVNREDDNVNDSSNSSEDCPI